MLYKIYVSISVSANHGDVNVPDESSRGARRQAASEGVAYYSVVCKLRDPGPHACPQLDPPSGPTGSRGLAINKKSTLLQQQHNTHPHLNL
jgi:hypothetical protein